MLPVLLSKIKSDSADIRFLSLKIFTDIVMQYLNDDSIYDPKSNNNQKDSQPSTKLINDLLYKDLFPSFNFILTDNDPVPLFGLKLLSAIVERNQGYVKVLNSFNLIPYIVEYYSVNNPKLNRHTMKIMKNIIESKELDF